MGQMCLSYIIGVDRFCGQVVVYFMISSEFVSTVLDTGVCLMHKTACVN